MLHAGGQKNQNTATVLMTQSGGCFCSGHALHVDIHEHHIKATRFKVFQEVFAAGKAMDLKLHCQLRTQAVQSMLHVGGFLRHIIYNPNTHLSHLAPVNT